jgi:hypothetical protein
MPLIVNKQTPWPESAKLVPTFAVRGVSHSQRGGSPMAESDLVCFI